MTIEQSIYLAEQLNKIGVIIYVEVNGVQHQFGLSNNDLSPTSVIYQHNKANITLPNYTLVPINIANQILRIGKKIFHPQDELRTDWLDDRMTGADYITTALGRYMSLNSESKFRMLLDRHTDEMRHKADETLKNGYEEQFRNMFIIAYNYFGEKMKEFRNQLKMFDGELSLFWSEVENIFIEFQKLENEFSKQNRKGKLSIHDLRTPELKTAYKFRRIPRSYGDYRKLLGYSYHYTGFHPLSFIDREWKPQFEEINGFPSVRKHLFS